MKRVLIAHQSAIPHYRVPFYNALEQRRPPSWSFDAVFDPDEITRKSFFNEPIDLASFKFPTLPVRTIMVGLGTKKICYQTFLRAAAKYDLIIVENAVNNLSYPLSHLHQLGGKKIAYWGHGRNRTAEHIGLPNRIAEAVKLYSVRQANGFFAYTEGVKMYLVEKGIGQQKIFVLNNSIDIKQQRLYYEKYVNEREKIRKELGVEGKKVLLFVGRISRRKRIDLLIDALKELIADDKGYHLLVVGDGDAIDTQYVSSNLTQYGSIIDLERLAPLYVASDVYVLPGVVGLGPLQGLCYDLPAIVIDSPYHNPEIEYLTSQNSVMLGRGADSSAYAGAIRCLFQDEAELMRLRSQSWPSIQHLTIENMADRFIDGVNHILAGE